MKIAAFDLGRHLGWATNLRQKRRWGHEQFSELRAHRLGEFMLFLLNNQAWLKKVDVIVFETPFTRGRAATRSLWGMAGVLESCASVIGKPVVDVSVATIKKFAAGNGHAPKDEMVAAARKLGYRGKNDNEADAYCLLKYAEANLERGEGNGKS